MRARHLPTFVKRPKAMPEEHLPPYVQTLPRGNGYTVAEQEEEEGEEDAGGPCTVRVERNTVAKKARQEGAVAAAWGVGGSALTAEGCAWVVDDVEGERERGDDGGGDAVALGTRLDDVVGCGVVDSFPHSTNS